MEPIWSVAATVSEPDPLVLAFVAHYLDAGANTIYLYFDEDQPDLRRKLSSVDACIMHVCDSEHWKGLGVERPWTQTGRQIINLQHAYNYCEADWLLHVDADEYLVDIPSVVEQLESLPEQIDTAMVRVSERVHINNDDNNQNIFDGVFRGAIEDGSGEVLNKIDKETAKYRFRGLISYSSGKSFVRTGRKLTMGIHAPAKVSPSRSAILRGAPLLHFDGLTPLHWIRKRHRTLAQQPNWRAFPKKWRRGQFEEVYRLRHDQRRSRAYYQQLKTLSDVQLEQLMDLGLINDQAFDPRPSIDRVFPKYDVDLTAQHFDDFDISVHARPKMPMYLRARLLLRRMLRKNA